MKLRNKKFHLQHNRILGNEKGLSLIELLISIVILTLIAGAFLGTYVHATKSNINMGQVTDGASLVQQWMEELYSISKSPSVTNIEEVKNQLTNEGFTVSISGSDYIFKQPLGDYYLRIVISTGAYTYSNMFKVVATAYKDIGYTDLASKMQSIIVLD